MKFWSNQTHNWWKKALKKEENNNKRNEWMKRNAKLDHIVGEVENGTETTNMRMLGKKESRLHSKKNHWNRWWEKRKKIANSDESFFRFVFFATHSGVSNTSECFIWEKNWKAHSTGNGNILRSNINKKCIGSTYIITSTSRTKNYSPNSKQILVKLQNNLSVITLLDKLLFFFLFLFILLWISLCLLYLWKTIAKSKKI